MEVEIGEVTHYFGKIRVAVLELDQELKVGDQIHIIGHTTDFNQKVASMQIEHKEVPAAGPGADVAIKVKSRVRSGDAVFKVEEE
ncbi:MAG: hypothetical protein OEV06_01750 [Anaerolineae bacterium]|nr:hypothetical protein [Anaerolineae bacterium]